ncbi:DUF4142 domain-containing protein [Roseiconus nitratireducens]|uniref:DUF4142 domain-containing protein n=1 Tax=Roseiconus nitratireducens TaxID=2605748 RepID=A0A5M6D4Y0_9BACT|nr:DUF4142 domain-containing protein [Roseiconus nitratireducens]KAA5541816.1 DUF4142 domain-containing protein [Roseiconus nitratireducens]
MSKYFIIPAAITLITFAGSSITLAQEETGNRYEARRVASENGQQNPTVPQALVMKLRKANDASIELAKMVQDKTDHADIRQLTQTIARDHQILNRELEKLTSDARWADDQGKSRVVAGQSPQRVPEELCKIADQACSNALKMTKEMFAQYSGQDLDMAFLGHQIVAHTMLLSELQAIRDVGPGSLQPFSEQAIDKVQKHLKRARQLAKRFEDEQDQGKDSQS